MVWHGMVLVSYTSLESREGEPRQRNKVCQGPSGLLGLVRAYWEDLGSNGFQEQRADEYCLGLLFRNEK